MPRKTKEGINEKETKAVTQIPITKKPAPPRTATANTTKKGITKKANAKTTSNTKSKNTASKKNTSTTKSNTRKSVSTKANAKNSATKMITSKAKTSSNKKVDIVEYYDLPYRYNQTIVKVLAQTPTNLFIYWDISDKDRKNFQKQYGNNFFETTRPILIIHNDTLDYRFEIEINDFANSWYLHVADSKCDYRIELGRRPIKKTEKLNTDYIYITTSNEIEAPNDRILLDNHQKMVYFRNVKTGKQTEKQLSSISLIRNMGKIYDIYDLYQEIYQEENLEEIYLPSSGNPSSKLK